MIIKSIYTRRLKAKSRTKEECKAIIAIVLLPTLVNKDVYIKFAKEFQYCYSYSMAFDRCLIKDYLLTYLLT